MHPSNHMKKNPLSYQPNPTTQSPHVLFAQATIPSRPFGFSAGAYGTINRAGDYFAGYVGQHSRFAGDPVVQTSAGSLFDVASVTKSVVALIAFYCMSHGHLRLESRVRDFIPGLRPTTSTEPTILDLLTYRARIHLDQLEKPYTAHGPDELFRLLSEAPVTVGNTLHYSNYPPILLGMILESASSWPLKRMAQEILFDMLGMSATFDPPKSLDRVVATEIDAATGRPLCGTVHDEFTRASRLLGGAGLFCACEDLLLIGELILNRGSHKGRQLIHERYINMCGENQFATGSEFGIGFGIWREFASGFDSMEDAVREIGPNYADGAIFKNGFGSATLAVFPMIDRAVAIMTNYIHPMRQNSQWINRFRYAAIMGALTGRFPSDARLLWSGEPDPMP